MMERVSAVRGEFCERAPVLCPRCGAWANRIRRRPVDRVVSIFGTVWRFRCSNAECNWRGTVRMKPTSFRIP